MVGLVVERGRVLIPDAAVGHARDRVRVRAANCSKFSRGPTERVELACDPSQRSREPGSGTEKGGTEITGKLVRDLIPEIIQATGRDVDVLVLDNEAYIAELHAKLHEEASELAEASADEVSKELADVLEVVRAIAEAYGLDMSSIDQVREAKRAERGGFTRRLYLYTA